VRYNNTIGPALTAVSLTITNSTQLLKKNQRIIFFTQVGQIWLVLLKCQSSRSLAFVLSTMWTLSTNLADHRADYLTGSARVRDNFNASIWSWYRQHALFSNCRYCNRANIIRCESTAVVHMSGANNSSLLSELFTLCSREVESPSGLRDFLG